MDTHPSVSPSLGLVPDAKRKRRQFQRQPAKRSKTLHQPSHLSAGTFQCFTLSGDSVNVHRRSNFSSERRKEVKGVRRKGACLRCRLLKRQCSGEDPCKTCIAAARAAAVSRSLGWMECIRPSFQAINIFDAAIIAPDQTRVNQILSDLLDDDVYLDFHLPWDLNVDAASAHLASWLSDDQSPSTFSVVGVFSCSSNTNLLKNALDPNLGRDLRLFVHLTTHLYTTGMQGGYQQYTDEEIRSVRDCVGNRLLLALDPLLRPTELEATEDKLAKLKALFLLLLGTTIGMRYTCPELVDRDHEGFEGHDADPKQAALLRLLCHYLIYIGKATSLIGTLCEEKTLVKKWKSQWNKPAAFTWNYSTGLEMHYRIQPAEDWIVSSSEDESMSSIDLDLDDFDFDSLNDADEFTTNSDLLKCAGCGTFWADLDAIGLCQKCQPTLSEDWMNQLSMDIGTAIASNLEVSNLGDHLRAVSETDMDNWFNFDGLPHLGTDLPTMPIEQVEYFRAPGNPLPLAQTTFTPEVEDTKTTQSKVGSCSRSPDRSGMPGDLVKRCISCLSRGAKYGYNYPICAICKFSEHTVALSEPSAWDSILQQVSVCDVEIRDAKMALTNHPSLQSSSTTSLSTPLRFIDTTCSASLVAQYGHSNNTPFEGWMPSPRASIEESLVTSSRYTAGIPQTSEHIGSFTAEPIKCPVCDHVKDTVMGCCKAAGEYQDDPISGFRHILPEGTWSCGQCSFMNLIPKPPESPRQLQGGCSQVESQLDRRRFRCTTSFCRHAFSHETDLRRHLKSCSPPSNTKTDFTCLTCCRTFNTAERLRYHQGVCHRFTPHKDSDSPRLDFNAGQGKCQNQDSALQQDPPLDIGQQGSEPEATLPHERARKCECINADCTGAPFGSDSLSRYPEMSCETYRPSSSVSEGPPVERNSTTTKPLTPPLPGRPEPEVFRLDRQCPSCKNVGQDIALKNELSTLLAAPHEWSRIERKFTFACGHVLYTKKTKTADEERLCEEKGRLLI